MAALSKHELIAKQVDALLAKLDTHLLLLNQLLGQLTSNILSMKLRQVKVQIDDLLLA